VLSRGRDLLCWSVSSNPFREIAEADSLGENAEPEPSQNPAQEASATMTETALPPRNFSIALEDRMRAFVNGPPAYMRRKRRIEDLADAIGDALLEIERGAVPDAEALARRTGKSLATLNELIAVHNRYYPCEANLPLDPRTGALLERGSPWAPLPAATKESLLAAARARR
jgi:hypothetical protein